LVLTACLCFLLRYCRSGSWKLLVCASLMAGIGYLLRPIGLYLIGVCLLAVLLRVWADRPSQQTMRPLPRILAGTQASAQLRRSRQDSWRTLLLRRMPIGCPLAIIPALALAAPWMINNAQAHRNLQVSRCLDYVLYGRAVTFDDLNSTGSAAMAEIHETVEQAVRSGHLPPDADYRDRGTVIQAYSSVHNTTFAESSAVMGRAGRDLMFEHPWPIAVRTVKYAWWMLLLPDPVYRFQPGGASGIAGKRNPNAAILDIGTYSFGPGSWEHVLRDYRRYLPLNTVPRPFTPLWTAITHWFYKAVDRGTAPIGLRDSVFEELMLICLVGGVLTLFAPRRGLWLLVAVAVVFHVCLSAFLGGPTPRYAVAVKPLLLLYAAFLLVGIARAVIRLTFLSREAASAVPANVQGMR